MKVVSNLKKSFKLLSSHVRLPVLYLLSGLVAGLLVAFVLALLLGDKIVQASEDIASDAVTSTLTSVTRENPLSGAIVLLFGVLVMGALEAFRLALSYTLINKKSFSVSDGMVVFRKFLSRIIILLVFNNCVLLPVFVLYNFAMQSTLLMIITLIILFGVKLFTQYNNYLLVNSDLKVHEAIIKAGMLAYRKPELSIVIALLLAVLGTLSSLLSFLDVFVGFVISAILLTPLIHLFMFLAVKEKEITKTVKKIKVF